MDEIRREIERNMVFGTRNGIRRNIEIIGSTLTETRSWLRTLRMDDPSRAELEEQLAEVTGASRFQLLSFAGLAFLLGTMALLVAAIGFVSTRGKRRPDAADPSESLRRKMDDLAARISDLSTNQVDLKEALGGLSQQVRETTQDLSKRFASLGRDTAEREGGSGEARQSVREQDTDVLGVTTGRADYLSARQEGSAPAAETSPRPVNFLGRVQDMKDDLPAGAKKMTFSRDLKLLKDAQGERADGFFDVFDDYSGTVHVIPRVMRGSTRHELWWIEGVYNLEVQADRGDLYINQAPDLDPQANGYRVVAKGRAHYG